MAIYLEYEGIKGSVTANGYKDHIEVLSVDFKVARSVSMTSGNLFNRKTSPPSISQASITKAVDSSSSVLFNESVTGSTGKKVIIKFVHTNTKKVVEFLEHTLENCIISSYKFSVTAEGQPQETIHLSFSKILINYKDHGGSKRAGYNLETEKAL